METNASLNVQYENLQMPPSLIHKFDPSQYSIIVIDDDPDHLMIAHEILKDQGYRVHARKDPLEGLKLLNRIYFDLLICDLRMPGLSGLEIVCEIRKVKCIPAGSRIPIVIMTSAESDYEAELLRAGADLFCNKRVPIDTLLAKVKNLLIEG